MSSQEEIERLQYHIDQAFARVLARDLYGVRKALTDARWGVPKPEDNG